MNALQKLYKQKAIFQWHSHFATRPGKLFVGVDMNLTITLLKSSVATNGSGAFSTTYHRWRSSDESDRESLFHRLNYRRLIIPNSHPNAFPKLGAKMEANVLEKLHSHQRKLKQFYDSRGVAIYYHSGGRYWRKALPDKLSSHYKEIKVDQRFSGVIICLLNSQLYYWYWIANSNCMDVVSREVDEMPVFNLATASRSEFEILGARLLAAYMTNRTLRTRQGDIIATDEFNFDVKECKPIIDEIDRVLAQHYGFTNEELDFIINYDIKYRMGNTADDE
ncbi:MAG: hypothetical protein ONB48_10740 [candidate division KSB1 bacterium]|nr:hypothetical protein [candidate division KSB1 bacterium]MDZ7275568.1 hypothetical protein [candidate division KSB1 bacterium]MDZ7286120.1 hypothetical protein [candidate division KSB1 bacterium]MDZ7296346.1 hypothetical protein [candidate division KSB1 bacterium]MDZ7347213.1 hypothetical protein [candidate division KSB1 bacterium]